MPLESSPEIWYITCFLKVESFNWDPVSLMWRQSEWKSVSILDLGLLDNYGLVEGVGLGVWSLMGWGLDLRIFGVLDGLNYKE